MLIERYRVDPRTGRNGQFPLRHLLLRSVYSRLAGLTPLLLTGERVAYEFSLLGE